MDLLFLPFCLIGAQGGLACARLASLETFCTTPSVRTAVTSESEGTKGTPEITVLDVLRGLAPREQLRPDAPPCLPRDMLDPDEVAALRRCRPKTVYDWRSKGRLHGPEGRPVMFYGWSVLQLLGPTNAPEEPKEIAPKEPTPIPTKPSARSRVVLPYPGRSR